MAPYTLTKLSEDLTEILQNLEQISTEQQLLQATLKALFHTTEEQAKHLQTTLTYLNNETPLVTYTGKKFNPSELNNLCLSVSRLFIYSHICFDKSISVRKHTQYFFNNKVGTNQTTITLKLIEDITNLQFADIKEKSKFYAQSTTDIKNTLNESVENTKLDLEKDLLLLERTITSRIDSFLSKVKTEHEKSVSILDNYNKVNEAALNNLASSFATFSIQKRTEVKNWLSSTKFFGCTAAIVAALAIIFHPATGLITQLEATKGVDQSIATLFSSNLIYFLMIEALIIYFFRISLNNFYAARDELLQLEIREALCKFAPTYTAFAEANDTRLDNFTKHIFSPLASKMNPTPHPLDFLGQVCNVVNNGKKK